MQIKTIFSYNPKYTQLYEQILNLPVDNVYPNYTKWFKEKFLPGHKKKERICIVAQEDNGALAGCALIKNTKEEKKICTLFVHPKFRGKGLGKQLISQALKELGEYPLITVSGRNLAQLSDLLAECGFHLSAAKKGVYNSEDTEYYFNDKKADFVKDNLIPVLTQRIKQLKQK